jgi:hypothetical protein
MSERNRRVLLVGRPAGIPLATDFAIDNAPLAPLVSGQFRVRNHYLSVDPAQRGWAADVSNYSQPVPLGSVMRALAVGRIVASRHPDFPVGTGVYGWFGWQQFATAGPADVLTRVADTGLPLSAHAGVLGINGLTAWLAFHDLGRPRGGETVLVSTAAGAVGSIVGQLAKAAGCVVVGLTGSDEKAALCLRDFGCDRAFNYRSRPLDRLLAEALPEGADIFFDNVGGEILDRALRSLRPGGRLIQCGTASIASWDPAPTGPRNEREVLTRRLTWSGFVIFDHAARFAEAAAGLVALIRAGALTYREDIRVGLDEAPGALGDVYAGRNTGKTLIDLTGEG